MTYFCEFIYYLNDSVGYTKKLPPFGQDQGLPK